MRVRNFHALKISTPTIDKKIFSRMFDPIECDESVDNIGVREFHPRNYGLLPAGK